MSWLAPKLKFRCEIAQEVQTPNAAGGMDRTYPALATVWCAFGPSRPRKPFGTVQTVEQPTHEFTFRANAYVVKDAFLTLTTRARRFRVVEVTDPGERGEYVVARCEEVGAA